MADSCGTTAAQLPRKATHGCLTQHERTAALVGLGRIVVGAIRGHVPNDMEFRRHHIGRALGRALWMFESQINEAIRQAGFPDFRQSDAQVIRSLPTTGASIVELAERAQMTKQGMSKLVANLEERGYLLRRKNPNDGRSVAILLSARGKRLLEAAEREIAQLEARWAKACSVIELRHVKSVLLNLVDTLGDSDYL